jgi:ectoine hydroxylase-related dioxygenase (phytanoyl-CoA dioxygenase family)
MSALIEACLRIPVDKLGELGFCVLRQAIPQAVLADAQEATATLIDRQRAEGQQSGDRSHGWQYGPSRDGTPILFRLNGPWLSHGLEFAARLMALPEVLRAVADIMEGDEFAPTSDALIFKDRNCGFGHRWHQDPAPQIVSPSIMVGFHLDASDQSNGALRVVPGSHRTVMGVDWSTLPEPEWYADRPDTVVLEANAGDVTIHSTQVVHGSLSTSSPQLRRIYYIQFDRRSNVDLLPVDFWMRRSFELGLQALRRARQVAPYAEESIH